jgi:hypothetical protein
MRVQPSQKLTFMNIKPKQQCIENICMGEGCIGSLTSSDKVLFPFLFFPFFLVQPFILE